MSRARKYTYRHCVIALGPSEGHEAEIACSFSAKGARILARRAAYDHMLKHGDTGRRYVVRRKRVG